MVLWPTHDKRRHPLGGDPSPPGPRLQAWAEKQPTRERDELLFPVGDGHSPLNDSVLREAHDKGKVIVGCRDSRS